MSREYAIFSTPFVCEVCNLEFKNAGEQGKHFESTHPMIKEVVLQDGRKMDLKSYCVEFGPKSNPEPTQSNVRNKRNLSWDVTDKGKRILSNNDQPQFPNKIDLNLKPEQARIHINLIQHVNMSNHFQPPVPKRGNHSIPNKFGLYTTPKERNMSLQARDKGNGLCLHNVNGPLLFPTRGSPSLPNKFDLNEKVGPTQINKSNPFFETIDKGKGILSSNNQPSLSPSCYRHLPSLFPMPKIAKSNNSFFLRLLKGTKNYAFTINVDNHLKNSPKPHTSTLDQPIAHQDTNISDNDNQDKEGESDSDKEKIDLNLKL